MWFLRQKDIVMISSSELRFQFVTSRGPGGQNVNRTHTKVLLFWYYPTSSALTKEMIARLEQKYAKHINKKHELIIASSRFRDRARNIADAINKLEKIIAAISVKPKIRKPTRAPKRAAEQRLLTKKKRGRKKADRQRPIRDD
jgi:ribosome-associated protein